MHYLNGDGFAKVVSIASPLFTSLVRAALGEATRAIDAAPGGCDRGERLALSPAMAEPIRPQA